MQLSVLSTFNKNIRRVHVDHNSFAEGLGFKTNFENRIYSKFIHQFITITPFVKKKMHKYWKIPLKKIKVILNGVDVDVKVEKDFKKKLKLKNKKIVSIIGGLRRVKDHPTLFKAVEDMDVKVLVCGDGPLRKDLEKIAPSNVTFLGNRDDYLKIIKISDVIVCSSLNEGISIALLEAMALGKPIIASNVGGNKIIIKDNGFLFEKRDHEELKRLLEKVLSKNIGKELGDNGKKRVEEYYNVKRMVEEYKCAV